MRFFFYGTLCDADVRDRIIGPDRAYRLEPARLAGYARVYMRGRDYPVIVKREGAEVSGCLARGLDRAAAARIDAFETDEYSPGPCLVQTEGPCADQGGRCVEARAYFAADPAFASDAPWSFEQWRSDIKPKFLAGLDGWLAERGIVLKPR